MLTAQLKCTKKYFEKKKKENKNRAIVNKIDNLNISMAKIAVTLGN